MQTSPSAFVVGIDLGTTNSAVSYVDLRSPSRDIRSFPVPQLTGAGVFAGNAVLPSFLYIPGAHEMDLEAIRHPWPKSTDMFAGVFAREYGGKVPSRLVASAKSWLCHDQVDRRAPILPWGAPAEIPKISPIRATALYLGHIRSAWNAHYASDGDLHLEHQKITITVPASFDEVAREMTLEAAREAGLPRVTLLEEPLAAFYSWLLRHEKNWMEVIRPGELVLVCDMGGGTTDFTLISLKESEDGGSPRFERLAVGEHLILGGDNVDLTLARLLEMKLGKKDISLSGDRWKILCHLCRGAKERLLDGERERERITLVGEGRKLIGDTVSAFLEREEVERVVLEGFFPGLSPEDFRREAPVLGGVTEFGLPYASDPALTRHMAGFLHGHGPEVERRMGRAVRPDHILFNGGALKPLVIRNRIREAVAGLFSLAEEALPKELDNPHPDLAVSLGAAYYGLVKAGMGVKVGSGSPRSYYIGVAVGERKKALCLVERGLDEGSSIELPQSRFEVQANQPVQFDVYASSFRSGDRAGDLVTLDDSLAPLPPLKTLIRFGKKEEARSIPVHMAASYTEMGTLALWCRSEISDHRWELSFQLRQQALALVPENADIVDADRVDAAVCASLMAFEDTGGVENPVREISAIVLLSKNQWPLDLLRKISDALLSEPDLRRISPVHEARWLNLLGFCLRPGTGDAFDEERIRKLWRIYKEGPVFANKAQNRNEWWVLWRRVAAGLGPGRQRQMLQDLSGLLFPKGKEKKPGVSQEMLEIWAALANMEHLSTQDKVRCAKALLPLLHPRKSPERLFWAFSRLCSRSLLYGPADRVIPPDVVSPWVEKLLAMDWTDPEAEAALLLPMARMTGDRVRDLSADLRRKIREALDPLLDAEKRETLACLEAVLAMERQEEREMFGESLPPGLRLHPEGREPGESL
ncbi:Hsp70 family protein [Desulfobotulus sp.]|jgi:molecular chaperone DnaK (HSP70)|uniref:Hsp70 family protein n=1 Tax=Desulfobotulus sp. TaxID=1940337 RepID=UPI002A3683B8|nr:Hsp70 family protein [Desulfobotulus sp.]MDY0162707.1 Hsp70 family protein [Desulfobotulus sp.]